MNTVKETIEGRLAAFTITIVITYLWTGKLIGATGLAVLLDASKAKVSYL